MATKQPETKTGALKTIDINCKSFMANGNEYFIERSSISMARFIEYEKIQIELGYGVSFSQIYEHVKDIYEMCNKMEFANIAVRSYKILEGIKKFEERSIPALTLCALFINTKDEDRRVISKDIIDRKLDDWDKEGLDITPFFQLAIASLQGFLPAYKKAIQTLSVIEKAAQKKNSQSK